MDLFTVIVCTAVVSAILASTMASLYLGSRRRKSALYWCAAGVSFLLSNLIAMLAVRFDIGDSLHPMLPNAFYIMGHAALTVGVAEYVYGRHYRVIIPITFFAVLLLHLFPLFEQSVEIRMIILSPVMLMFDGAALTSIWRYRRQKNHKACWPIIVTLLLFMTQMIIRTMVLLDSNNTLALEDSELIQTVGSLAVIIFISMLTVSFIALLSWDNMVLLKRASETDFLTGWLNRKALASIASKAFREAKHRHSALGFVLFDIDHFKKINDAHGHHVGDMVLQHVSQLARETSKRKDACFRIGGEEFVVLLEDTSIQELHQVSELIRVEIEKAHWIEKNTRLSITVSVGSALSQDSDKEWNDVLGRADSALYNSKRKGRNCATVTELFEVKMT
jgi:diguanylate cyclase (GGDEF)-like protein